MSVLPSSTNRTPPMAYRCPWDGSKIVREVVGEEVEVGRHEVWWHCTGRCRKYFGPPWLEHQWPEPDADPAPVLIGFEAWAEPTSPASAAA